MASGFFKDKLWGGEEGMNMLEGRPTSLKGETLELS